MSELYKAIAGSPITYLSSDISATQTTISIADDSALPDAPNICTIGYGENLETIKYGVKSNGVLQEVVRGIEGTPRAWPAGTEVARFFTAYDHNAIIENFNSHLAESVSQNPHGVGSIASQDYEEGSWTPGLKGTNVYVYQKGVYTKIGRYVIAFFNIKVTSIGDDSNPITIDGLPFTAGNYQNNLRFSGNISFITGVKLFDKIEINFVPSSDPIIYGYYSEGSFKKLSKSDITMVDGVADINGYLTYFI